MSCGDGATHAVYYRDERGIEPVDAFINGLPPKRAATMTSASSST